MNERLEGILKCIRSGKTREEISQELGYKSYKSLDMFMRRNNYIFDSKLHDYVPANSSSKNDVKEEYANIPAKAASIINLFDKKNTDPKTIAKLMRFSSYSEMAAYMKSKGYVWSNDKSNYVFDPGRTNAEAGTNNTGTEDSITDDNCIEKYIPLLNMLDKNKELLLKHLMPDHTEGTAPRYLIPGVFITKSIHMSSALDRLVKEYSTDKNISQREIFEIALVNFFRQYGYRKEIDTLLEPSTQNCLR